MQAPTPLQLSEFLREVASGGPTAASSMWHACHWFSEKMGCQLPTDHFLTRPFKMHAVTHTGSQALELSPGELVNLVLLASRSRGTKAVLLAFMIQSAVSCVRFEHIQRSTLVKLRISSNSDAAKENHDDKELDRLTIGVPLKSIFRAGRYAPL